MSEISSDYMLGYLVFLLNDKYTSENYIYLPICSQK
jgi:hypothetical protein